MDLREKLKWLESDVPVPPSERRERFETDIGRFVEGEEASNAYGSFFRSVTVYPLDHRHGHTSLNLLSEIDSDIFSLVGKDEALTGVDLCKAIFLDTETTGLAGGTGTVPFLVGMGSFSSDGFRIEQFFMRDYDEEQALLHAVRERFEHSDALVSYNGKGYDLNLLRARFTLARMETPALHLPHLDLLYTARRLWRRRIADCTLPNIERCILHFHRQGDVPSYLIPGLYFDYLRSRQGKFLEPVFRHNRWDIVTLAALAGVAGRIYQNPQETLDHPLDFLSLGKALENAVRLKDAALCFQEALHHSLEKEEREEALRFLGFSLKRSGDWEGALRVWQHMTEALPHRIYPYEELAKYYEHRMGDFKKAAEVVERALDRIRMREALRPEMGAKEDMNNLTYRLSRLKRKIKRQGKYFLNKSH